MNVLTHSSEAHAHPCCAQANDDRLDRARRYLDSGLVAPATELYEAVLAEGEGEPARHGLARCAYLRGDLHEALGHLQMLTRTDEPSAEVINDLGVVYFELGLKDEAHARLRTAAERCPDDPVAWRNLVDVALACGDRDACRFYCEQLVTLGAADEDVCGLMEQLR